MVTSVLQDQQYIFDVRSLLVGEKMWLMKKDQPNVLFWRLMQRSHCSKINLDNMLKNKTLMFDIQTGFIAERIHFSGTRNSQWC